MDDSKEKVKPVSDVDYAGINSKLQNLKTYILDVYNKDNIEGQNGKRDIGISILITLKILTSLDFY